MCGSLYTQAVRLGNAQARSLLPRVLHLLSFDNHNGCVGGHLDKAHGELPPWVWFMWIPQLLASLQRPEAQHVKLLLQQVSAAHPQVRDVARRRWLSWWCGGLCVAAGLELVWAQPLQNCKDALMHGLPS